MDRSRATRAHDHTAPTQHDHASIRSMSQPFCLDTFTKFVLRARFASVVEAECRLELREQLNRLACTKIEVTARRCFFAE